VQHLSERRQGRGEVDGQHPGYEIEATVDANDVTLDCIGGFVRGIA
jgi:hypothetical protein